MASKKDSKTERKGTKKPIELRAHLAAEARAQMAPALLSIAEEMGALLGKGKLETTSVRYHVGELVNKTKRDPKTYGVGAMDLLATAFGCKVDTLDAMGWVAEAWADWHAFDVLRRRLDIHGQPLSWGHFEQVAKGESNAEKRAEYIELALAHGLSVNEIRRIIAGKRRPVSRTRDAKLVRQVERHQEALFRWTGKMEKQAKLDAWEKKATAAALERGKHLVERLERLLKSVSKGGEPLDTVREKPNSGTFRKSPPADLPAMFG